MTYIGIGKENHMIQKFRKLPIIVEAVQFKQTYKNAQEIIDWVNKETKFATLPDKESSVLYYSGVLRIKTLDNVTYASKGDWIIKDVDGEFYSVKSDIFERTYRIASPDISSNVVINCDDDWSKYLASIDKNEND